MSIVQNTDFTGEYKIPSDTENKISNYITKFEEFYLVRLLGAELYDLFIADLTVPSPQVPQSAIYLSLFNPFNTDDNGCLIISEGMKQMLVQFIYFHFMRDMLNKKTTAGVVRVEFENSTLLNYNGFNLVESYNEGINNYHTIRWFILDNSTDYPEENGIIIDSISGI